jgi:hypothetical protein
MKNLFPYLLIFLTSILLGSCSTNRLLSSWNDESYEQSSIAPILVLGVTKNNETKRRIYEDTFVDSLNSAQTMAIASYTLNKQSIEPTEEALRAVIKKTKAKTILITHLVSGTEKAFFVPSSVLIGTNSYDRLYSYYPFIHNSVASSGSFVSTSKVILETSLYDVETEKLIWTARTESIDPVMTRKYYQQLIDLFLNDLSSKKML